ncbi:lactococcin family bacteriocin [Clostridium thermobutyricum]|uniref:lactococcin family bacteriocin n=1 Tax=Clostridium thermobutyricum TaxID=29372 RepID=UPI0018ABBF94|nr:lactococcin family bacteriocin [Clostridium thermobutyricum]
MKQFNEIANDELSLINGGAWETIWAVGPGLYQRDTETGEYRWIQTQDNLSYTTKVITNGWVGAGAGGYFGKAR